MSVAPLGFWEKGKLFSPNRATRPYSLGFFIALAIAAQLCLTPVNCNRCKVDAEKFDSLDNTTCLPRDYRDLNEVTVPCSTTVTVLFSCLCKDNTGLAGGNSVRRPSYCLMGSAQRTGDYTADLKLGICTEGQCENSVFGTVLSVDLRDVRTAERLDMPPLPACTRDEANVRDIFKPLASCELYCENRDNIAVNDGSPCVLEWFRGVIGGPQVQLTGQCWNGVCKFPQPFAAPIDLGCIDQELLTSATGIVSECTFPCGRSTQRRPNGVTCLIQPATAWHAAIIGVCFKGKCREIVEVKNQPLRITEDKEVPVGASCVYVAGNQLTTRRNGAFCVFRRSRFRGSPQLVGYCSRGNCRSSPPYSPPPQKFKLKECQVKDVKLTAKLQVAESCTVTCRNYRTERRPNGILCLYRYRIFHCQLVRTCSAYTIGQCYHGHCIYTSQSWDMHV